MYNTVLIEYAMGYDYDFLFTMHKIPPYGLIRIIADSRNQEKMESDESFANKKKESPLWQFLSLLRIR
ncbi:hypothetical protein SANA_15210 [Gottschalkiaceae bacterium SANA]|nr:hypothetical protein SANA_15210 [Gottschalkiaceae bacterium SANA]